MSNYVPPHRRKDDTNEIKNETEQYEKNIPVFDISGSLIGTSYLDITENGEPETVYNYTDNIRPGWSIIKKNTAKNRSENSEYSVQTSNVIIIESPQTKDIREKRVETNDGNAKAIGLMKFDNMLNNWDNFRDIENDLQGDVSIYDNYKEELAKMRLENEEIDNMIEEYARKLELSDSESDDDDRYR